MKPVACSCFACSCFVCLAQLSRVNCLSDCITEKAPFDHAPLSPSPLTDTVKSRHFDSMNSTLNSRTQKFLKGQVIHEKNA